LLSLARAESVAKYLATSHGILTERLKPEGKGSTEPMNKSRIDAPENRRVTIVSMR
jgi:flagellar motor protein MotB